MSKAIRSNSNRRRTKHDKKILSDSNDARRTALAILDRLQNESLTLDAIITDTIEQIPQMSTRDRSLMQTIVYGVLRWQRRLDFIIDRFSKKHLNRIDPIALNLLRIAIFQMIYLDRIPVSAAVNTTVEISKSYLPIWVVRFINGVLRQVSRNHADLNEIPDQGNPALNLSIEKSFPPWLIKRWLQHFGPKETEQLCDAVNTIPNITIRINSLKAKDRQQVIDALQPAVDIVFCTDYSPLGLKLFGLHHAIDQMEPFKAGLFQVQDEAAQLVTLILDPKPGETVLDACAGLGGKTGHIAQAMENRGCLVAADHSSEKLDRLNQEMKRLGVDCVQTWMIDWDEPDKSRLQFDRILLDAPCSGLGVMRRNPDIKWRTEKANLKRYAKRQALFLTHIAPLVKPGGIVVYVVCSFEPEENEQVINGFLKNHTEFVKEDINLNDLKNIPGLSCKDGFFRTFPHSHTMDGFFAARLKRTI
jgi:16S rRNA (cytosine967-C5)-methyltransferase